MFMYQYSFRNIHLKNKKIDFRIGGEKPGWGKVRRGKVRRGKALAGENYGGKKYGGEKS